MIPLSWILAFSLALFFIGLFGAIARKNAISILMGIELMLNAVNINLLAFWRYLYSAHMNGLVFIAVVFAVAAAETAVGLALIISAYRNRRTITAGDFDSLKG
ncbi:NADH-quinone oxidoreductase subunit NuoK [Leptolinea tardivitalis]|uniref:NADH-quinone oxidoreductase subunit K n=1 Tax=Leptolinea tardivitalis TaxID=229920 RepID=A0A0P6WPF1_9CHLR|nr:NADH-quinone oxidoreductase subunit NuoK [Leptolinea tardivitalis]KPL71935.1 NADH-ubiquinone oxidoreductase subunit 4L [Leptolinea tardivitalis]GAP19857.1 NADH dehydrogenase subunit K [Leptolinea tardivitalis]